MASPRKQRAPPPPPLTLARSAAAAAGSGGDQSASLVPEERTTTGAATSAAARGVRQARAAAPTKANQNLLSPSAAYEQGASSYQRRRSTLSANGFFIDYSCTRRRSSAALQQQQARLNSNNDPLASPFLRQVISPALRRRPSAAVADDAEQFPQPPLSAKCNSRVASASPRTSCSLAPTTSASWAPRQRLSVGGGGGMAARSLAGPRKTSIFDPTGHSLTAVRRKSTMPGAAAIEQAATMMAVSRRAAALQRGEQAGRRKRELVSRVPVIGCSPTSIGASLAALDKTRRYDKLLRKLRRHQKRKERERCKLVGSGDGEDELMCDIDLGDEADPAKREGRSQSSETRSSEPGDSESDCDGGFGRHFKRRRSGSKQAAGAAEQQRHHLGAIRRKSLRAIKDVGLLLNRAAVAGAPGGQRARQRRRRWRRWRMNSASTMRGDSFVDGLSISSTLSFVSSQTSSSSVERFLDELSLYEQGDANDFGEADSSDGGGPSAGVYLVREHEVRAGAGEEEVDDERARGQQRGPRASTSDGNCATSRGSGGQGDGGVSTAGLQLRQSQVASSARLLAKNNNEPAKEESQRRRHQPAKGSLVRKAMRSIAARLGARRHQQAKRPPVNEEIAADGREASPRTDRGLETPEPRPASDNSKRASSRRQHSISLSAGLNFLHYYYYLRNNSLDQRPLELPTAAALSNRPGASPLAGGACDAAAATAAAAANLNQVAGDAVTGDDGAPMSESERRTRLYINYSLARLEIVNCPGASAHSDGARFARNNNSNTDNDANEDARLRRAADSDADSAATPAAGFNFGQSSDVSLALSTSSSDVDASSDTSRGSPSLSSVGGSSGSSSGSCSQAEPATMFGRPQRERAIANGGGGLREHQPPSQSRSSNSILASASQPQQQQQHRLCSFITDNPAAAAAAHNRGARCAEQTNFNNKYANLSPGPDSGTRPAAERKRSAHDEGNRQAAAFAIGRPIERDAHFRFSVRSSRGGPGDLDTRELTPGTNRSHEPRLQRQFINAQPIAQAAHRRRSPAFLSWDRLELEGPVGSSHLIAAPLPVQGDGHANKNKSNHNNNSNIGDLDNKMNGCELRQAIGRPSAARSMASLSSETAANIASAEAAAGRPASRRSFKLPKAGGATPSVGPADEPLAPRSWAFRSKSFLFQRRFSAKAKSQRDNDELRAGRNNEEGWAANGSARSSRPSSFKRTRDEPPALPERDEQRAAADKLLEQFVGQMSQAANLSREAAAAAAAAKQHTRKHQQQQHNNHSLHQTQRETAAFLSGGGAVSDCRQATNLYRLAGACDAPSRLQGQHSSGSSLQSVSSAHSQLAGRLQPGQAAAARSLVVGRPHYASQQQLRNSVASLADKPEAEPSLQAGPRNGASLYWAGAGPQMRLCTAIKLGAGANESRLLVSRRAQTSSIVNLLPAPTGAGAAAVAGIGQFEQAGAQACNRTPQSAATTGGEEAERRPPSWQRQLAAGGRARNCQAGEQPQALSRANTNESSFESACSAHRHTSASTATGGSGEDANTSSLTSFIRERGTWDALGYRQQAGTVATSALGTQAPLTTGTRDRSESVDEEKRANAANFATAGEYAAAGDEDDDELPRARAHSTSAGFEHAFAAPTVGGPMCCGLQTLRPSQANSMLSIARQAVREARSQPASAQTLDDGDHDAKSEELNGHGLASDADNKQTERCQVQVQTKTRGKGANSRKAAYHFGSSPVSDRLVQSATGTRFCGNGTGHANEAPASDPMQARALSLLRKNSFTCTVLGAHQTGKRSIVICFVKLLNEFKLAAEEYRKESMLSRLVECSERLQELASRNEELLQRQQQDQEQQRHRRTSRLNSWLPAAGDTVKQLLHLSPISKRRLCSVGGSLLEAPLAGELQQRPQSQSPARRRHTAIERPLPVRTYQTVKASALVQGDEPVQARALTPARSSQQLNVEQRAVFAVETVSDSCSGSRQAQTAVRTNLLSVCNNKSDTHINYQALTRSCEPSSPFSPLSPDGRQPQASSSSSHRLQVPSVGACSVRKQSEPSPSGSSQLACGRGSIQSHGSVFLSPSPPGVAAAGGGRQGRRATTSAVCHSQQTRRPTRRRWQATNSGRASSVSPATNGAGTTPMDGSSQRTVPRRRHSLCLSRRKRQLLLSLKELNRRKFAIKFSSRRQISGALLEQVREFELQQSNADGRSSRRRSTIAQLGGATLPDAFLVVYSISDRDSFAYAKLMIEQLRTISERLQRDVPLPIMLVANKSDLERNREVKIEEGRALARALSCKFIEISCAIGFNLDNLIVGLRTQLVLKHHIVLNSILRPGFRRAKLPARLKPRAGNRSEPQDNDRGRTYRTTRPHAKDKKRSATNGAGGNILVRFYKRYVMMDNYGHEYECDNFSKL